MKKTKKIILKKAGFGLLKKLLKLFLIFLFVFEFWLALIIF